MVTSGVGQYRGRQYLSVTPSTPVSLLMQEYGFHGPAMNVSAMCTSGGSAAIVTAKSWLDSDLVDDVLVVATDLSAKPEVVGMFVQLGVAVTDTDALDACRPFQTGSRGFTFGEAAIAFTMTNRAIDGYADVLGGGAMSHDAYHVTSVDPELTNVVGCVEQALSAAGVAGEEIRYLNAHGPGTRQCDRAEATIAETMLPNSEVFSVKPLAGHCQGAAGAVELAASLLGYDRGEIPATPRVSEGIPQLLDGLSPPLDAGPTVKTSLGDGWPQRGAGDRAPALTGITPTRREVTLFHTYSARSKRKPQRRLTIQRCPTCRRTRRPTDPPRSTDRGRVRVVF